jgi:hypothetical protein
MTLYTKEDYLRMCADFGIDPDAPPEEEEKVDPSPTERLSGRYILMDQTDTYAKGVAALKAACASDPDCHPRHIFRKDGSGTIYRPLTFKENIEARVEDYNTRNNPDGTARSEDERQQLFASGVWNDSCTGIAYKANSTKFKIIFPCEQLINIDSGFNSAFLPVDYDALQGIELDTTNGIYRALLTKSKVLEHPAWLAAVEDDKVLLKEYADIMFDWKQGDLMAFWTRDSVTTTELRALCVDDSDYGSVAFGGVLDGGGRFVRCSPKT